MKSTGKNTVTVSISWSVKSVNMGHQVISIYNIHKFSKNVQGSLSTNSKSSSCKGYTEINNKNSSQNRIRTDRRYNKARRKLAACFAAYW